MYSKVLLAFDGSPSAMMALQEATKIALSGAKLLVVTVAEHSPLLLTAPLPIPMPMPGHRRDADLAAMEALDKCHILLQQVEKQLAGQGINAVTLVIDLTECPDCSVAKAILDEANDSKTDIIVMGTHARQGLKRFLLGSVAASVVREALCPVLLVPDVPASAFACLNPAEIYGQWPEDEKIKP